MLKNKKRSLILILALAMLASFIFAACGNGDTDQGGNGGTTTTADSDSGDADNGGAGSDIDNFNATGFPIVDEPITMTMMGFRHPIQGPWENLKFFDHMEELTNIKFEFDTPPSDGFVERRNLAFSSGQYPDVFFGAVLPAEQEVRYGMNEGILIPLNDLIENYATNINMMFNEKPDIRRSITTPDGNIYSMPNINTHPIAVLGTLWYNGPWLENLGVTELPTHVDEFYDLLIRFRDEDPNQTGENDTIPFTMYGSGAGNELNNFILPAFGILRPGIYVEDDVVKYGYMEENYSDFIAYANKLWSEGLIDPDSFSQDYTGASAKTKANLAGVASQAIPQNLFDVVASEDAVNYPASPALSSDVNPQQTAVSISGVNRGAFAITDTCEYPEAAIRWVDYLFSEEGSLFIHYGEEGDLWQINADGLAEYIIPDDGRTTEEYRGGDITPDCGTPLPKWVRDDTEEMWDDVFQQFRIQEVNEKIAPHAKLALPDMYTTSEEQNRLNVLMTDITNFTETAEAQFYVGDRSIGSDYDEFISTLEQMGIQEVIDIYQAAYDRWLES